MENSTLGRFFRQDKKGIVDLKLSTKSGRIIHIEIQVNKKIARRLKARGLPLTEIVEITGLNPELAEKL